MLILTRKPGESLYIGDDVKVTIVEIKGHQIRVGIEAPSSIRIYREEIYLAILDENKRAAAVDVSDRDLEGLSEAWTQHLPAGKGAVSPGASKLSGQPVKTGLQPQIVVRRKKKDEHE